jgi:hypothetical protein
VRKKQGGNSGIVERPNVRNGKPRHEQLGKMNSEVFLPWRNLRPEVRFSFMTKDIVRSLTPHLELCACTTLNRNDESSGKSFRCQK